MQELCVWGWGVGGMCVRKGGRGSEGWRREVDRGRARFVGPCAWCGLWGGVGSGTVHGAVQDAMGSRVHEKQQATQALALVQPRPFDSGRSPATSRCCGLYMCMTEARRVAVSMASSSSCTHGGAWGCIGRMGVHASLGACTWGCTHGAHVLAQRVGWSAHARTSWRGGLLPRSQLNPYFR